MDAPGTGITSSPRFVADRMLGRLVRWLRIIGCDVLYGSNLAGRGLVREARSGGRIVLTRDRRLIRDPEMPPHLFIEDDLFRCQLRQVVDAFGIDPYARLFSRCIECNTALVEVGSEAVRAEEVPEFVYRTQKRYRRCPRCAHLYWDATHVARVREELGRMGFGERTRP
ncbi:MAG: Mut7-C RNAse domain-containing protein [Candidatus Binatia bacterium]